MKVIKFETEYSRPQSFTLYPIGDIHAGSIHCSERSIAEKVKEIKDNPRAFWLSMGDLADCITKDDRRFDVDGLASWVQKGNIVESQRQWLVELLSPIKHKGIAMLTGNHEETIHLHHQNDLTLNLANDLGIPYASYACFVRWRFSRGSETHVYTIHAWHGAGSAVTVGARVNRLKRLIDTVEADVFLMGHLHDIVSYQPEKLVIRNDKVKNVHKVATLTGSWLRAYTEGVATSYAERNGYPPTRIGCPKIIFTPDRDTITLEQ